ncbi:MAG: type II toxin-antitoxin system YafQ family toxin [Actinobacteria bacterium]|nr:type II toxin-antitoxin system YafQ family toxin [Actinomycetota bacterium]
MRAYDCNKIYSIKYQDHPLSGDYTGFRACHIQPDWLLVYLVENNYGR